MHIIKSFGEPKGSGKEWDISWAVHNHKTDVCFLCESRHIEFIEGGISS